MEILAYRTRDATIGSNDTATHSYHEHAGQHQPLVERPAYTAESILGPLLSTDIRKANGAFLSPACTMRLGGQTICGVSLMNPVQEVALTHIRQTRSCGLIYGV